MQDTFNTNSPAEEKGSSLWADAFHRLKKNKLAMAGGIFLAIEVLVAIFTPWIAPHPFDLQNLEMTMTGPSSTYLLGTDSLGRDLLTRVLYGGRISLTVGILASLVSVLVGVFYGAVAGFLGGKIDNLMMRIVDVLYALPFIFMVIILMVYFGRNFVLLFVALGFTQWLTMARIVRGQVMSLKQKEFVEAARSIGVSDFAILVRHLIPNSLGPVIVYLTLTVPAVILEEAFLSFLGLGVQAPMASWGTLISSGVEAMEIAPRVLIAPALALDPKGARD
jgi:oligopeptide transport system permease protein